MEMKLSNFREIIENDLGKNATSIIDSIIKDSDKMKRINSNFSILPYRDRFIQYCYTSAMVKMGNMLEKIIGEYWCSEYNLCALPRDIVPNLNCDFVARYANFIILVEMKVRDDHDSTKRKAQVENYIIKRNYLQEMFPDCEIMSCMWFMDTNLTKNKSYYSSKISLGELLYGKQIETFLDKIIGIKSNNFYLSLIHLVKEIQIYFGDLFKSQNYNLDYKNYSITVLNNLITNSFNEDDIADMFFNGTIPYMDIYEYALKARQVPCKKDFISFLKCKLDL